MKKKKDAALEYMLKLGIFPAKSPSGALEQLRTVMDPETLKEVLTAEDPLNQTLLYSLLPYVQLN